MQDAAAGGMGCLLSQQCQRVSPALEETIQGSPGSTQSDIWAKPCIFFSWFFFLVQPEPMVGVHPPTLGWGLSKASTLLLDRPAPPRSHSAHPKAATWEGGAEGPLGELIPHFSCHHVLIFQVIKALERDLPSSLSCACGIQHPAADVAAFRETHVSKLCLQRGNPRYEPCA